MRSLTLAWLLPILAACSGDDAMSDAGGVDTGDAIFDVSDGALMDAGAVDAGTDGGATDVSENDAGGTDAGGVDATIPLPDFPDFPIGPYASAITMLVDSLLSNAASLDTSARYGESAAQGYLLQGIGELLWASRDANLDARDSLITAALGEIDELESAAGRTTGAAPAF
jgi:hypothetical protein